MKRSLLYFVSLIGLLCLYSCTEPDPVYIYGNIAGKVTEEGSNNAIEGATIEISGIEQSVKTGSNGMFKFEKRLHQPTNFLLQLLKKCVII